MRDWKLESLANGKEISPIPFRTEKEDYLWRKSTISKRIFQKITVPFDFQPKFPDPLANLIQGKHPTDPMISVFIGSNGDPRNEFNCKREQHYLGSPVLGLNRLHSKIFGKKVLPRRVMQGNDCLSSWSCYRATCYAFFFTHHDYFFMQSVKILHFSQTHCKLSHFDIFGPDSSGIVIAFSIRVLTGYQNIRRPRKLPLKNKKDDYRVITDKYAMEFTTNISLRWLRTVYNTF